MQKKLAAAIALALISAGTLAGCSSADDSAQPSKTPQSSATAKPDATVYDECVDGSATILTTNTEKGKQFELGDCANVSIVGLGTKGSSFELGAVETLVIEGDEVTATVATAKKIIVAGKDNTISYGGDAEVVNDGKGNTIVRK